MSDAMICRIGIGTAAACVLCVCACTHAVRARAGGLPAGYWTAAQSQPVIDKTQTIRLDPDVSYLKENEREGIRLLLDVGERLGRLYEESKHFQALSAYQDLVRLDARLGHPAETRNLIDLYRLFKGPIGRGLDGRLSPFLPVEMKVPGKNVYPWGITRRETDDFLAHHPEERPSILALRSVVRRSHSALLERDMRTLEKYDVLATLHPGLAARLRKAATSRQDGLVAVPYSVAYADSLMPVYDLLNRAANVFAPGDIDFARYLRQRSVDLLRDDYEAGDAAWVTGRFGSVNAQIGSYETYDDELYGVKSFFGASVLVKDREMTESLGVVVSWLQEFEDELPYEHHKQVRTDIPVGVYNVIADFGQARGTNTATILPNESYITRKYGRTILIRRNILENPDIFAIRTDSYRAAVADEFHDDYHADGDFFRTLFHEVGHYLGPDGDKSGRPLDLALQEDASILEELKADLVSLFISKRLFKKGYYSMQRLRAVEAAGVHRVLQKNQPKKSQVYNTMELMQMNYFLEKGLLEYDRSQGRLLIHYDEYFPVVESMLKDVLALQYEGDKSAADQFIDKYMSWNADLHGRLASQMKDAEAYRYVLVRYAALGE